MQLTLRRIMDTAKQHTKSGNLNEFSMVLLNNILSLPLGALLIFAFNEVEYLSKTWANLTFTLYSQQSVYLLFYLWLLSMHFILVPKGHSSYYVIDFKHKLILCATLSAILYYQASRRSSTLLPGKRLKPTSIQVRLGLLLSLSPHQLWFCYS